MGVEAGADAVTWAGAGAGAGAGAEIAAGKYDANETDCSGCRDF